MRPEFGSTACHHPGFQSTHPVWDATVLTDPAAVAFFVSIHAPRMGCDHHSGAHLLAPPCFNPRTPYGMRLSSKTIEYQSDLFQSTHPVWDATIIAATFPLLVSFQSTHPVWDATAVSVSSGTAARVSIHAPRMGCDRPGANNKAPNRGFQSTHPVWDATGKPGCLDGN